MKATIIQYNPTIGNIEKNKEHIIASIKKYTNDPSPILLIYPELAICGYPPRDLLTIPAFLSACSSAISEIKSILKKSPHITLIVGTPRLEKNNLFNSAAIINSESITYIDKQKLPTYDVFDESRYFHIGTPSKPILIQNTKVGIVICEDAWSKETNNPIQNLANQQISTLIILSASPFEISKQDTRFKLFSSIAKKNKINVIAVNQIGANDELVFDGTSLVFNQDGCLIHQLASFKEDSKNINLTETNKTLNPTSIPHTEQLLNALVLGVKDYIKKCNFKGVIIGLSGGIDSAVTAAIAAKALGKNNVLGVLMPSKFSSKGSIDDSLDLAKNLGIKTHTIPINDIVQMYSSSLNPIFKQLKEDITEENIQARTRGTLLMAISNKLGYLVLTTGNKSELAVGYCTLYGDMCGGLAILSDVPKIMVYELANELNKESTMIPNNTITKPPSAELRPNQTDQDSLPNYSILDDILEKYIHQKLSQKEIVDTGHDSELVKWVLKLVNNNEYKRRQAAPGLKVTETAFGIGRRMPVAANYSSILNI
ncbi:NAD+ synthase [Candidatus Marinamargulisbacteria bacterium SCGC AG-410-N11]|nr:NAD+ synthase [Candidatus Marinamargulisbacteria bacterium SCGC AG-410-N11]